MGGQAWRPHAGAHMDPFPCPMWKFNVLDWDLALLEIQISKSQLERGVAHQQTSCGPASPTGLMDFYLNSMLKTFTTLWLFSKISLGFKIILFSASMPPLILCIYTFPIDGTGISCFLHFIFVQIFPVWDSQVYFPYSKLLGFYSWLFWVGFFFLPFGNLAEFSVKNF